MPNRVRSKLKPSTTPTSRQHHKHHGTKCVYIQRHQRKNRDTSSDASPRHVSKSRISQGVSITDGPIHTPNQPHARNRIPSIIYPVHAHTTHYDTRDWRARCVTGICGQYLFTLGPFLFSSALDILGLELSIQDRGCGDHCL